MTEVRITARANAPANLADAVTGNEFVNEFGDKKKKTEFEQQLADLQDDNLDLTEFVSVADVDSTLPNPDDFKTMRISEGAFQMTYQKRASDGTVSNESLIKRHEETNRIHFGHLNWESKHNPYVDQTYVQENMVQNRARFLLSTGDQYGFYEKYFPIRFGTVLAGALTSSFTAQSLPRPNQDHPSSPQVSHGGTEVKNVSQYEKQCLVTFQTASRQRLDLKRTIVLIKTSDRIRDGEANYMPLDDGSLQTSKHFRKEFRAQSGGLFVESSDTPHIYSAQFLVNLAPTDGFTIWVKSEVDLNINELMHGGLGTGTSNNNAIWVLELA